MKKSLASRFIRETEAFISHVLRMKGMVNADGRPVERRGSEPLDINSMLDLREMCVVETDGVEVDDTPTDPNFSLDMEEK